MMRKSPKVVLIFAFLANMLGPLPVVQAQEFVLPKPGVMVSLSPEFTPAHLKGITIHPENALKFDFIIHKGDTGLSEGQKQEEYKKLIKYFLASLAVPDENQWVNLSPYEKDRIIKDDFGKTEMGRDLLSQDYLLKQITASLIYPEQGLGQKFWDRVYEQAFKQYGNTNIPVNTFNKVWIVPDNAVIYEKGNTAYVLKNHLKVMLEEDYLALEKNTKGWEVRKSGSWGKSQPHADNPASQPIGGFPGVLTSQPQVNQLGSQIVREVILPALEKEVNEGKNFAQLRQVYSGMILAAWYKRALKESLLGKIYADKAKLKGLSSPNASVGNPDIDHIYQQYLTAFKKGVYNYIKEDTDKYTHQVIPRKYFSGGTTGYGRDFAQIVKRTDKLDPTRMSDVVEEASQEEVVGALMQESIAATPIPDAGLRESFYRQRGDHHALMASVNPQRNGAEKNKVIRHDPAGSLVGTNIIRPYIKNLLAGGKRFIVITSQESVEQMREWNFPGLETLLQKAVYVQSVHYGYLRMEDNYFKQAERIEPRPELIVVIGKGSAEDWGKIIGHKFDIDVDIIPTAVSTNAMWTSNVAIRDGEPGQSDYDVFGYVLGAARFVLIDTDFVRLAKRDNIAGAGDLFSSVVALEDWKLAIQRGAEKEDPEIFGRAQDVLDELFAHADDIRQNTPKGIEVSARLGQRISKAMSDFWSGRPKAGSDHILSDSIEVVTGSRHMLHGEQVAIATLLMAFLYNKHHPGTFDLEDLKTKVRSLGLPLRLAPDGVNMTRDELIKALVTAKPRPGRFSFFDVYRVSEADAKEAVDALFPDAAMVTMQYNRVMSLEDLRARLLYLQIQKNPHSGINFEPTGRAGALLISGTGLVLSVAGLTAISVDDNGDIYLVDLDRARQPRFIRIYTDGGRIRMRGVSKDDIPPTIQQEFGLTASEAAMTTTPEQIKILLQKFGRFKTSNSTVALADELKSMVRAAARDLARDRIKEEFDKANFERGEHYVLEQWLRASNLPEAIESAIEIFDNVFFDEGKLRSQEDIERLMHESSLTDAAMIGSVDTHLGDGLFYVFHDFYSNKRKKSAFVIELARLYTGKLFTEALDGLEKERPGSKGFLSGSSHAEVFYDDWPAQAMRDIPLILATIERSPNKSRYISSKPLIYELLRAMRRIIWLSEAHHISVDPQIIDAIRKQLLDLLRPYFVGEAHLITDQKLVGLNAGERNTLAEGLFGYVYEQIQKEGLAFAEADIAQEQDRIRLLARHFVKTHPVIQLRDIRATPAIIDRARDALLDSRLREYLARMQISVRMGGLKAELVLRGPQTEEENHIHTWTIRVKDPSPADDFIDSSDAAMTAAEVTERLNGIRDILLGDSPRISEIYKQLTEYYDWSKQYNDPVLRKRVQLYLDIIRLQFLEDAGKAHTAQVQDELDKFKRGPTVVDFIHPISLQQIVSERIFFYGVVVGAYIKDTDFRIRGSEIIIATNSLMRALRKAGYQQEAAILEAANNKVNKKIGESDLNEDLKLIITQAARYTWSDAAMAADQAALVKPAGPDAAMMTRRKLIIGSAATAVTAAFAAGNLLPEYQGKEGQIELLPGLAFDPSKKNMLFIIGAEDDNPYQTVDDIKKLSAKNYNVFMYKYDYLNPFTDLVDDLVAKVRKLKEDYKMNGSPTVISYSYGAVIFRGAVLNKKSADLFAGTQLIQLAPVAGGVQDVDDWAKYFHTPSLFYMTMKGTWVKRKEIHAARALNPYDTTQNDLYTPEKSAELITKIGSIFTLLAGTDDETLANSPDKNVQAMYKNGVGPNVEVIKTKHEDLPNDPQALKKLGELLGIDHAMQGITDKAVLVNGIEPAKGGIDLNAANLNLQIKRDGKGVPLPLPQQDLEHIKLDGLVPVILEIKPALATPLLSELQVSGAQQAKI